MNNSSEKSFVDKVLENLKKAWDALVPSLKYIKNAILYYLKKYPSMLVYIQDYIPGMQEGKNISREIRLTAETEMQEVDYDDDGWQITLPDCCVVSGDDTDNSWISEEKTVENYFLPIMIPFALTIISLFFSLLLFKLIILPLGILAGMIIGYMNRKFETVHIKYRKSDQFRERKFPQLRIFGNELIVRVGHRTVRQKFFKTGYKPVHENSATPSPARENESFAQEKPVEKQFPDKNEPPRSIPLHEGDDPEETES
jgi:hypothetical protein